MTLNGTQNGPNWATGYVPPATEWEGVWQSKLDQISTAGVIYAAGVPYDVTPNTSVDQTANLQSALNAASSTQSAVMLPGGYITINGTGLSVPQGVALIGPSQGWPYNTTTAPTSGTTLVSPFGSYGAGTSPVLALAGNNTIAHLAIFGPGNGGYGASTSRPAIYLNGNQNFFFDVSSFNSFYGINCNYNTANYFTNCQLSQNQTGIINPVDSHILGCDFASNGVDVSLQSGASTNLWVGNRFEFNSNGSSVVAYGGSNTTTQATSAATTSGSTLTFASAPAGALQGYQVYNQTHPSSIPAGTYITSASPGTSITLSAAVASTVSNGDVIEFYITNCEENTFSANQWDRSYYNALNLQYVSHFAFDASNIIRRPGAGATANTSNDAAIYLSHVNTTGIIGVNLKPGKSDAGAAPYSPSWGVWDGGANFGCTIMAGTWVYNPVNGTNGGGINTTANFTNFNSQNTVIQANPYIVGQP